MKNNTSIEESRINKGTGKKGIGKKGSNKGTCENDSNKGTGKKGSNKGTCENQSNKGKGKGKGNIEDNKYKKEIIKNMNKLLLNVDNIDNDGFQMINNKNNKITIITQYDKIEVCEKWVLYNLGEVNINCMHRHNFTTSNKLCSYYNYNGFCTKNNNCSFLHILSIQKDDKIIDINISKKNSLPDFQKMEDLLYELFLKYNDLIINIFKTLNIERFNISPFNNFKSKVENYIKLHKILKYKYDNDNKTSNKKNEDKLLELGFNISNITIQDKYIHNQILKLIQYSCNEDKLYNKHKLINDNEKLEYKICQRRVIV